MRGCGRWNCWVCRAVWDVSFSSFSFGLLLCGISRRIEFFEDVGVGVFVVRRRLRVYFGVVRLFCEVDRVGGWFFLIGRGVVFRGF